MTDTSEPLEPLVAHVDVDDPSRLDAMASATARQRVIAWANWGVRNSGPIHYSQLRPMDGVNRPGKLPLYTDCSAFVTLCYRWGGAADPNGSNYNGYGFTGTLMRHLTRIRETALRPGDLVTFGAYPGNHVVIMVGSGANGLCVSHGQERGPLRYELSVAKRALAGPVMAWRSLSLPLTPWGAAAGAAAVDDIHDEPLDLSNLPVPEGDASNPPAE